MNCPNGTAPTLRNTKFRLTSNWIHLPSRLITMLVEFALSAMDAGVPKRDAILDAVHKRARPIVMTTIAMAAGMLPSALGTSEGSEFRSPMAVAVIGGLLLSTLLSLLFVPSLFSVIHGAQGRVGRWMQRHVGLNWPRVPAE